MSYNENLANRIREAFAGLPNVEEKKLMAGLTFMVNGKMCVSAGKTDLMCRIDPQIHEEVLKKTGTRSMEMKGKPVRGYVFISEEAMKSKTDFDYWINLSLDFNEKAKASRKRKK